MNRLHLTTGLLALFAQIALAAEAPEAPLPVQASLGVERIRLPGQERMGLATGIRNILPARVCCNPAELVFVVYR